MRIQHNIMAMNSYRNLGINNGALSKNLEKLSSGYRINRAGDDAAGLAISEKMRAQIAGLDQAQKNAQSGINLVKTAEGALTEVHDMLNRMTTLATQSANGTYTDTDRAKIQAEIDALTEEIDRIADNSNFNGQKLLNGELDVDAEFLTSEAGKAAIDGTVANAIEVQDGQAPSAATAAKTATTLTISAGSALIGKKADGTNTTLTNAGGAALSDLFTIGGSAAGANWAANDTVTLTAKTKGALSDDLITELKGLGFDITNGSDTGSGAAATKATYDLAINVTKISGGDTFTIDGKTFEFVTDGGDANGDNIAIDITGMDSADTAAAGGQYDMMNAIHTAVSGAMSDYTASAAPDNTAVNTGTYALTLTANTAGYDGNNGEVRVIESTTAGVAGTYNPGQPEGTGTEGKFAQVAYNADLSKLAVGDEINIGGTALTIVEDGKADLANGKIALSDAQDGAKLAAAFESAGYNYGKIAYGDGKLTITATDTAYTAAQFKANDALLLFTPAEEPAAAETKNGAALTLQIGADSVETIKVNVTSMKAEALGIKDLDIGSVTAANDAIDTIKAAIEKVSVQRGDLGAIQNRLEHTINNLGVMEENIQDAESTIRDTDIADEMMAYTKNNILIQSAQAMLAQANQVPQGVLQLMG